MNFPWGKFIKVLFAPNGKQSQIFINNGTKERIFLYSDKLILYGDGNKYITTNSDSTEESQKHNIYWEKQTHKRAFYTISIYTKFKNK